jgi:hypothetical protein
MGISDFFINLKQFEINLNLRLFVRHHQVEW